ncbi:MAG: hypothetical protein GY881_11240 [Gammaproteobacteria bacterium]|jgi:endonuclease YncB( thermonuclease family)|nr:hypothetical protein [Gammaproteobacteria bacterium]MDP6164610.1 hypothetical protein [Gammaproteobacteria bacterium]
MGNAKRLRLAQINTPELGRNDRPEQPMAVAAKQSVQAFLAVVEGRVAKVSTTKRNWLHRCVVGWFGGV